MLDGNVLVDARYGGIVVRDAVRDGADWFVDDFDDLTQALKRHQVAFIGSGELSVTIRYLLLHIICLICAS
jgi:hypothetical protein